MELSAKQHGVEVDASGTGDTRTNEMIGKV